MPTLHELRTVASAADPQAAFEVFLSQLQAAYNATPEEMQDARADYEKQLRNELRRREVMEQLWPDAPPTCFIYACYCRPFSEYGAAPASVQAQQHQAADWPALIPHSYVASTEPLELPQVDLLRMPLVTRTQGEAHANAR